jgi:hypothetical protein
VQNDSRVVKLSSKDKLRRVEQRCVSRGVQQA